MTPKTGTSVVMSCWLDQGSMVSEIPTAHPVTLQVILTYLDLLALSMHVPRNWGSHLFLLCFFLCSFSLGLRS